ncbi:sulfatase [Siansivirga zeaxanthinifaciens]|uniref:Sulfatase n=1 Tax=Siansivirga zeaxanthinifaciens CC-SAMT-1 TaxID=1454006 RepID=A0A0C5VZI1_9FLAO|nr:sulfatase [Siansivirga zeaxanthinifaciens]AJR04476.1 sulfatase [Siansivirga zeaxanthinifaciens CC-SAMT-1]
MKQKINCIAFLLAFFVALGSKSQERPIKPNILFILVDDLGYSDLSCMGSTYYETPNVDRIAESGMVFTNGYAGCQVCSPSRATILTGQFTANHGVTEYIGAPSGEQWREKGRYTKLLPAEYNQHLAAEDITMPEAFKAAGYTTFFAGKWHLGDEGNYPEDHGFDINKGGFSKGSPPGGFFAPFNNPKLENHKKGENLTMRLAQETADFIKTSKNKPFFAYLSFYAVHAPIQTTKEKWMKYRDKAEKMGIEKDGFAKGDMLPYRLRQDNPVYAGLIETMDDAVGYVLNTLKETGLDKNTIVVFTSDNGGVVSGDNYSTSCLPLKGGKGHQWEGGIRIPYIIDIPWMNCNGKKSSIPVAGSDFYPTLLELAGIPLPKKANVDGKSIVPVLKGKKFKKRPLFWHYPHYGNQGGRPVSIIREGNWKLIHYWEDNHNELYNLVNDLHEDHNLAQLHFKRTEKMAAKLLNWLRKVDAKYPQKDPTYDSIKEQQAIANKQEQVLKGQGKLRVEMLDKNWQPNDNWWGSIITKD